LRGQAEQVLAEVERELAARPAPKAEPVPATKAELPAKTEPATRPVLSDRPGDGGSALVAVRHPEPKRPFLKRHWWIIPASAVVVGVGVGLGVYYGTRSDSCRGADLTCWDVSK
jgi:hypothetical protein